MRDIAASKKRATLSLHGKVLLSHLPFFLISHYLACSRNEMGSCTKRNVCLHTIIITANRSIELHSSLLSKPMCFHTHLEPSLSWECAVKKAIIYDSMSISSLGFGFVVLS